MIASEIIEYSSSLILHVSVVLDTNILRKVISLVVMTLKAIPKMDVLRYRQNGVNQDLL